MVIDHVTFCRLKDLPSLLLSGRWLVEFRHGLGQQLHRIHQRCGEIRLCDLWAEGNEGRAAGVAAPLGALPKGLDSWFLTALYCEQRLRCDFTP